MGVSSFKDLRAWQSASAVRKAVISLCQRRAIAGDLKFRDQFDSASSSACRNLAEGFGRYRHPDFARFTVISLGSLNELLDLCEEASAKGYISSEEHGSLTAQIAETIDVTNRLRRYLQNTPTPKERLRHKRT